MLPLLTAPLCLMTPQPTAQSSNCREALMLLVQLPGDGDWDGDRDRELLSARKGFLAGSALTVIVRGSGMLCEDASED